MRSPHAGSVGIVTARAAMRARWLVLAALVLASCAKKGSSCDGAKAVASQAIETARTALTTQIDAAMAREAKLAGDRVGYSAKGTPVPPELDREQAEAATATTHAKLDLEMVLEWKAQLASNGMQTVPAAPVPGERLVITTARTAVVAAVAQCQD